jgi:glucose-6-phosphate 1-dehydrogenase
MVIFGASGDLTRRKLIPALYEMGRRGQLPEGMCVLGVSRSPLSDDEFRSRLTPGVRESATGYDESAWRALARRVFYHAADATDLESYRALSRRVAEIGDAHGISRPNGGPNSLFYLSVAPALYEPIIAAIGAAGLVVEGKRWCSLRPEATSWQRIIVEKPFGTDLASARSLNRSLGRVFDEESIFRIDHYLGKELVQNLLVLRFGNSIFEPLWNGAHVDHVQVTAAEPLGVGSRAAGFYDDAGAVRDMIQSHLLQVLALVAIEPPSLYDPEAIMREKIKLIGSASAMGEHPERFACLGRYGRDAGTGEPAYVEEEGVDASKRTETYAAMRLEFDTWRWAGVPFYVRTGKKMARKLTEIVVQFRRPPTNLFRNRADAAAAGNRLVIGVAPREGISLEVRGKVPGAGLRIDTAALDLDYVQRFGGEPVEAYGPLLLDAMRGDRTLYKHRDEVEGGWRICQPVIDCRALRERIETYEPGTWGPAGADELLARQGRAWHNPA